VKFCPKCGGIMVLIKKGDKAYLRCQRCGYEVEATEEDLKKYKVVSKVDEKEKVITTKVVSEAKDEAASEEEIERMKEEYYELVLEQLGEYGE